VQPCDQDYEFFCFSVKWNTGGMKLTGENRSTRGKTCNSATLSTTNPARNDPGSNPGLRGERPSTNHLSHGTAQPVLLPLDKTERLKYKTFLQNRKINFDFVPNSKDKTSRRCGVWP
jgi:hypothetical protein